MLGPERGGRIAAVCLFLSLLTPLALFHGTADVPVFALVAVAAAFGFERFRKLAVPFGAYALAFAYAVMRAVGLIDGAL